MSIAAPWYLVLIIPVCIGMWWWRPRVTPPSPRHTYALILRMLVGVCLVMALATPLWHKPPHAVGVVVVRDVSASIDASARQQQAAIIAQLQRTQPTNAVLGIVDVAAEPSVAAIPQPSLSDTSMVVMHDTQATALADAVLLAASLIPGSYEPHVLVLSDGNETRGRLRDVIATLWERRVVVDVVPLTMTQTRPQLALTAIQIPQRIRSSGEMNATVLIDSAQAQTAQVTVTDGVQRIYQRALQLSGGVQSIAMTLPSLTPGMHRLTFTLTAPIDDVTTDNEQTVLVERSGAPHILVLADPIERATVLVDAWQNSDVRVTLMRPSELSTRLTSMAQYDVIVLVDTPAQRVPTTVMSQIAMSVTTLGKGFLWVGGADSFGAGGYRHTPLADIAAVALDPQDPTQRKRLDLLLIIDRSGSMGDAQAGLSKLDLAKEAAFRAIQNLQAGDTVGVAFFADTATWALAPQPLPAAADVASALGAGVSDGGTSIYAGLQLALAYAPQLTGDVHHIILLSDGMDPQPSDTTVQALWAQQVSVSTIALGQDADTPTLQRLARLGHGTFYQVANAQELATVFLDDTTQVASRDIVEAEVLPQQTTTESWMAPLRTIAPIYGYNRTASHTDTRVLMAVDALTPLWAVRQVGQGQSMVWASDLSGNWGRAWQASPAFAPLSSLLLTPLLPTADTTFDMAWYWHDDILDIDITSRKTDTPRVALLADSGQRIDIPVRARGSTRWVGHLLDVPAGEYVLLATQQQTTYTRGLVLTGRSEMTERAGTALLADVAQRSGGRVLMDIDASYWVPAIGTRTVSSDISVWFLLIAVAMFVLEIALRRGAVVPTTRVWRGQRRGTVPTPSPPPPTVVQLAPSTRVDRLRAAKQRARQPDDLAE